MTFPLATFPPDVTACLLVAGLCLAAAVWILAGNWPEEGR